MQNITNYAVASVAFCMYNMFVIVKVTNEMQLCRIIYYSIILWLLYVFRIL
jgi:hypothetical protein